MSKYVNGMPDNYVVELNWLYQIETIIDFFRLLEDLILVYWVTVYHLVKHVNLSSSHEHKWIADTKWKLILYLNVTDSKTVLKFELCCFDHVLGPLEHEIKLKISTIEDYMSLLHTYLFRFSHNASLTYMLILYIEEVNLMRFFSNEPFFYISCIISLSFSPIAHMKGIKASVQILHLIVYIFKIFD